MDRLLSVLQPTTLTGNHDSPTIATNGTQESHIATRDMTARTRRVAVIVWGDIEYWLYITRTRCLGQCVVDGVNVKERVSWGRGRKARLDYGTT
jgi:hypothetical protein